MTGWDKFLHLLHIFGRLGWDATAKFTRPVMDIQKSNYCMIRRLETEVTYS